MNILLTILYVFLILYNPIQQYIPYSNYVDEIICIVLLIMAVLKFVPTEAIIHTRSNLTKIVTMCMVVFAIGILSNIIYGYASVTNIVRDVLGTFKFFITLCSGLYVTKKYKSKRLEISLIKTAKLFVTVIFGFAIISLFVNIGMGDSVRYGLRSFRFIYTHYTYLVFNEVLLLSTIMCENKKNYSYYGMSFATLILTLRTKAFLFVAIVIGISLLFRYRKKMQAISLKKIFKLRYILPLTVVSICIAKSKVVDYLSWGLFNSIRVGMHYEGYKIMLKFFPLGTGFATYGTNLSYGANSPVYGLYHLLNYQNLLDFGYATISDVYWPSIYAQFGVFGCIAFVIALFYCMRELANNNYMKVNVKKAELCIFLYMIVSSFAEAVFTNESGAFAPIVMILLACFPCSDRDDRNIDNKHKRKIV